MSSTQAGQPGDPEQLAKTVEAGEHHYEESRAPIVVYWDEISKRYRLAYVSQFEEGIEVVRIPK